MVSSGWPLLFLDLCDVLCLYSAFGGLPHFFRWPKSPARQAFRCSSMVGLGECLGKQVWFQVGLPGCHEAQNTIASQCA